MKGVELTQGQWAVVDDDDFEMLSQWKWHVNASGYAARHRRYGHSLMHRLIMNAPDGLFVDHINHNRADNRKSNLRLVTPKENSLNRIIRPRQHRPINYSARLPIDLTCKVDSIRDSIEQKIGIRLSRSKILRLSIETLFLRECPSVRTDDVPESDHVIA